MFPTIPIRVWQRLPILLLSQGALLIRFTVSSPDNLATITEFHIPILLFRDAMGLRNTAFSLGSRAITMAGHITTLPTFQGAMLIRSIVSPPDSFAIIIATK